MRMDVDADEQFRLCSSQCLGSFGCQNLVCRAPVTTVGLSPHPAPKAGGLNLNSYCLNSATKAVSAWPGDAFPPACVFWPCSFGLQSKSREELLLHPPVSAAKEVGLKPSLFASIQQLGTAGHLITWPRTWAQALVM